MYFTLRLVLYNLFLSVSLVLWPVLCARLYECYVTTFVYVLLRLFKKHNQCYYATLKTNFTDTIADVGGDNNNDQCIRKYRRIVAQAYFIFILSFVFLYFFSLSESGQ